MGSGTSRARPRTYQAAAGSVEPAAPAVAEAAAPADADGAGAAEAAAGVAEPAAPTGAEAAVPADAAGALEAAVGSVDSAVAEAAAPADDDGAGAAEAAPGGDELAAPAGAEAAAPADAAGPPEAAAGSVDSAVAEAAAPADAEGALEAAAGSAEPAVPSGAGATALADSKSAPESAAGSAEPAEEAGNAVEFTDTDGDVVSLKFEVGCRVVLYINGTRRCYNVKSFDIDEGTRQYRGGGYSGAIETGEDLKLLKKKINALLKKLPMMTQETPTPPPTTQAQGSPARGGKTELSAAEAQQFKALSREIADPRRYTDPGSLFDALAMTVEGLHPVRLVRMSWLLKQRGSVLRRRQELPEEAFVSADELKAVWEAGGRGGTLDRVAPLVVISFCWDDRDHPDPTGKQLELVVDKLQEDKGLYARECNSFKGFSEMGIFWDWPSLLQGDPSKAEAARQAALQEGKSEEDARRAGDNAKRTPAEKEAFKYALTRTMDLWYAHQATTVLLLTEHPRERGSERQSGYDQSGWTTYERCSAEQIKHVKRQYAQWTVVADLGDRAAGSRKAGRRWLVGPDQFDQLIEDRSFTNGADREAVKALYRKMSHAQLGGVRKLDLRGLPPPEAPEQVAGLAGCLRLCAQLERLELDRCMIGPEGGRALAAVLPSMRRLQELYVCSNGLGPEGGAALVEALPSLRDLRLVHLTDNDLGPKGGAVLARAFDEGMELDELYVGGNNFGPEALESLKKSAARAQCMLSGL